MEKIYFINSLGLRLAGIFHSPTEHTRSIIIMVHGFSSDKDSLGRFVRAAEEFCKAGIAVFRFDFSGFGESDQTEISIQQQVDDLRSAIYFVKQSGYTEIGLLGLSLGGLCAILAYEEDIKTLILWAPVTNKKKLNIMVERWIEHEIQTKGYLLVKDNETGREYKVSKNILIENRTINQQQILSKIICPVLIIHGTRDSIIPLEYSLSAMQYLPKDSKLEIIDGEDHRLMKKFNLVIDASLHWLKNYLYDTEARMSD